MNEQEKYESIWKHDEYRDYAPGEGHVDKFLELAKPQHYSEIIDFGCGTGRGARRIADFTGASVLCLDLADNCLDDEVKKTIGERFRFRAHDLTKPIEDRADFGFCTDVLEHIPPKDIDKVLTNIFLAARRVYLAISTVDDHGGKLIGEPLHLTVHDPFWWHDKLEEIGFRIDHSAYSDNVVAFYGSGYSNGDDITSRSSINVEIETLKQNIRENLSLGLNEVGPHKVQSDQVVYLLCGGPSLNDHEDYVLDGARSGIPCVTVNGSYNWLLQRKIKPAAQVMVDARKFNSRFINPLVDTCKYLICSQCDPDVLKSLPKDQTWLWHSANSDVVDEVLKEWSETHGNREWWPVYGGTTIATRALTVLAMLGFRKVEVFGWDSCIRDDSHHAYAQPENDGETIYSVKVGGKEFKCHGWMIVQANDFQKTVRYIYGLIPDFEMIVHGDGLIASMMSHAATLAEKGS